ncbi:MAG: class II aldolase/adducin family protein, partial [Methylobacterium sp.]|nr:class II aldolase/adducin family protein [Methylobacterium sp.]
MTALAEALARANRQLVELGLNHGSAGNVSVREGPGLLITPSGMTPAECRAGDMVWMDMQGNCRGDRPPSSEWRFHRDILASRPEDGAVVHT